jgi:hypothetical protein
MEAAEKANWDLAIKGNIFALEKSRKANEILFQLFLFHVRNLSVLRLLSRTNMCISKCTSLINVSLLSRVRRLQRDVVYLG